MGLAKTVSNLADDIPWAIEHFLSEGGARPLEASAMLDRFLSLPSSTDLPLAMISPNVDRLWHSMICHTEHYARLCTHRYGELIHHRPRTSVFPVPDIAVRNFFEAYGARYGPVEASWEEGVLPAVIDFARGQREALPAEHRWSGWPGRIGGE